MSVANNLKKHNRDISPMAQYDKNLESNHNLDKAPSETKDTEQNIKSPQSTTQLLELDTFKEYHAAFKETSDYKKLVESKAYKDSKDKDTLTHNAFLAYAKEIEKDKLLYFSLSFNQAPIIIKAPNDNKEQKRFLGYEWSNRKGDEGLKELHSPYLSPLFERDNPHNPNKLAHLIRQAFLEISSPIPQDLSPYAFKTKLIAMLDFSKVDFNKAISLNPTNSQGEAQNPFENCKYELVKLESVCKMYQPQTITAKEILEQGQYKVYGANGVIGFYDKYNHKDAEVAMTCRGATCGTINFTEPESWITGNAMIIMPLEKNLILKKFLIYILPLSNIKSVITGAAQPQITRTNLSQLKIPLPPLEIQTQIVAECEKVEEQYNTIRMSIEKYQELIKAILVKCGICHTERELVSTNTESNPVILSNSEKSKNKLDFSPFSKAQNDNFQALLDSLPTPPPQGWERVKLGQVVSVQSGGTPSREVAEYWNGDINWIKSEVCQNCYVYENQVKEKITKLGLKKLSAKILKKDSVLIALVGATIGKVGYLTFDSTTNQNIAGLYPLNSENLNTKFLYFACLGLYHLFTEKGGFTMANLTFIKNLKIPLPPLEAQESIVQAIESVENEITKLKEQSKTFESKKAEILKSFL
ncbi:restriction endonuclease subunit S [Campylobacter upsaliensis]|nr:restriction endonuclease subunit S [Campylobacter upsaliensis]MCR2104901.1 restriction endonuclease subunit S [Campylobacter upsaliensis]